ncbi:MAG: leucine-rich repeat protein, partial [Coriobacteriia bacterium]|nr:leucine-rich repeat protein [Coriobacteriia bacterium]
MNSRTSNALIVALMTLVLIIGITFGSSTGAAPGDWQEEDFIVSGNTITGLSASGQIRVENDKELGIPTILGVTAIGERAFQAYGLTHAELPITIFDVGAYAFADNQLTTIELPGVVAIGASAFRANRLTDVLLPPSVASIAADTFDMNGRVVAIHTDATGLSSSFTAGNGYVMNPVTVTVRLVNATNGAPIGDGMKLLGNNFNSAELFPAGTDVNVNAPAVAGWTALAPTTQTITGVQEGAELTFEYEFSEYDPIINVTDKIFMTGSVTIDETLIRSWVSAVSGVDGSPIPQSNISVTPTSIDASVAGIHKVSYAVADGVGNSATKTITVTIGANPADAYIGDSAWQYSDFEYGDIYGTVNNTTGTTLIGLSPAGLAKFNGGQTDITLPGTNPYNDNAPITDIAQPRATNPRALGYLAMEGLDLSYMSSLKTIRQEAFKSHQVSSLDFSGCRSLEQIGFSAFLSESATSQLTEIIFDNPYLYSIGADAFGNHRCQTLDLSKLPNLGLNADAYAPGIGTSAFACSADIAYQFLERIVFDNPHLTEIGRDAFKYHCASTLDFSKLPALERIMAGAFTSSNTNGRLAEIIFDNPELYSIGGWAFQFHRCQVLDFSNLPKLGLGADMTDGTSGNPGIGQEAFRCDEDYSQLTEIIFDNEHLASINTNAFFNHLCPELDLSKLPALANIGTSAFRSPSFGQLTEIIFDNPLLEQIGTSAFQNHRCETLDLSSLKALWLIGNSAFLSDANYSQLTEIIFNNPSLTIIGSNSFMYHRCETLDLSSLKKLAYIDSAAFFTNADTSRLTEIIFDNPALFAINGGAFQNHRCETLDLSPLPALTGIGVSVFRTEPEYSRLTEIIFDNPLLTAIDDSCFRNHRCETLDLSSLPAL